MIITIGSCCGVLVSCIVALLKVHKWFLKQEQQDKDIQHIKDEQRIMCSGLLACLDGLEQLGCNHSVPKTKEMLEEHINKIAHE